MADVSKEKAPGLTYARTDNGLELPVVDITHPLFTSSIHEESLHELRKNSTLQAEITRTLPDSHMKLLRESSLILGGFSQQETDECYVSGLSTMMMKLGPELIGDEEERRLDRQLAESVNAVSVRMRLRDICRLQSEVLTAQLGALPRKNLCFVNIAGGAASDSINTLILMLKEEPSLLEDIKIEINVLDIDTFGPHFAERSLQSLREVGGLFQGLNISFRHILYDWSDTETLVDLLAGRRERILMCVSEGGFFEYGTDEEIADNLRALYDNSPDDTRIAGTVLHELDRVDPTVPAAAERYGWKTRFLGIKGLENILEGTNWSLENVVEDNPNYVVFTLKKDEPVQRGV
jgi:hypothetical protein